MPTPSRTPSRKTYRYADIGPFYLSLEKSPLVLARLLYSKAKPFVSELTFPRKPWQYLPSVVKMYRVLRLVGRHSAKRYGLGRNRLAVVSLPVDGHLAIRLRLGGYKVFDLKRECVTTLLPPDLEPAVVEAKACKAIALQDYDFAPKLYQYSSNERWLKEAYIDGSKSPRVHHDLKVFLETFLPFLEALILAAPPRWVSLQDYLNDMRGAISARIGRALPNGAEREHTQHFAQRTVERLLGIGGDVPLVLSHGDLAAKNLLHASDGPIAIDWDTYDYRTPLYDLHFIFFIMMEREEAPAPPVMAGRIDQAVTSLIAKVASGDPALAGALFPARLTNEVYRRLYYLERILSMFEELEQIVDERLRQERLRRFKKSVDAFVAFERRLAESGLPSSAEVEKG